MHLGSLVRGAGQREVPGAQPRGVGSTALDQRQRLQHLAGRARQDHPGRIAPGLDHLARGRRDHRGAAMHRFKDRTTPDLGQHRIRLLRHCRAPFYAGLTLPQRNAIGKMKFPQARGGILPGIYSMLRSAAEETALRNFSVRARKIRRRARMRRA